MAFKHKDLLSLRDVEREEIEMILSTAASMRQLLDSPTKKTAHLQGKSIVTLFYENSTRTRMSFELASKYMSAAAANISASASSVQKGETLLDTGRTLDRMGTDVIIIRHPMSGAPHLLAQHVNAAVINAGDGINEHPTQALLDMFTIKRHKGRLDGSRSPSSATCSTRAWRARTSSACTPWARRSRSARPPTLMPAQMEELGVKTYTRVEEAVEGADVVMGLRIQKERQEEGNFPSLREYSEFFGINEERMKYAKPDALIMHPGPINRGVEITSDAADCEQSVINEQVTSGVAVRMALLYLLTRKGVQSV